MGLFFIVEVNFSGQPFHDLHCRPCVTDQVSYDIRAHILGDHHRLHYDAFFPFSISVPFQSPPATIGVPKYMRSDLPKLLISVSITRESAYLSLHLRKPIFLLIWLSASFLYRCLSATSLSPKYLTFSLTSMPSMY